MCSKKRPNNATSNYLVSMRAGDLDRNSSNFLGKLRANFVGTEFQVWIDLRTSSFFFVPHQMVYVQPVALGAMHSAVFLAAVCVVLFRGHLLLLHRWWLCSPAVCMCWLVVPRVGAGHRRRRVAVMTAPRCTFCSHPCPWGGRTIVKTSNKRLRFVQTCIRNATTTQVFDDGYSPKEQTGTFGGGWGSGNHGSGSGGGTRNQLMREELGCVMYASNVLGSRGPRKMQVGVCVWS